MRLEPARARRHTPLLASALAALLGGCEADDKVLQPDEDASARDAAQLDDSGNPTMGNDAGSADGGTGGADAAPSDAGTGNTVDASQGTPSDPSCDLNGVWIARQNTESLALLLPQYANNWYYLELAQNGDQVVVSKHFDCGIKVLGTVNVELKPETTRALMQHNFQAGRKGTVTKQPDGTCALEMERFWSVRGVSEAGYVPTPRSRDVSIAALQAEKPLPSDASGTEDWDGDGKPGTAWNVSGIASGQRHSAQRDWTRWFTAAGYTIPAGENFTGDVVIRAEFSNEEKVYQSDNPTLAMISSPNGDAPHTLTMRFLGRTTEDTRATALRKDDDFETCLAIQAALPAIGRLK